LIVREREAGCAGETTTVALADADRIDYGRRIMPGGVTLTLFL
jgi:hypothetical protein